VDAPLSGERKLSDLVPHLHSGGPQFAMMVRGNIVTRNVKEIGDRVVGAAL
jgi:hypothetical protein